MRPLLTLLLLVLSTLTFAQGGCPDEGAFCDDGNPCTENDVIDADCNCVGTFVICDDGNPCTDDICDPLLGGCISTPIDVDGDGFTTCDGDCDDQNPAIYPGAPEICDGIDNDCNGTVDGSSGCTDPMACNFNLNAVCDDGSCSSGSTSDGSEVYSPNWTGTDLDGQPVELYALLAQGKTVILDLFTYWCFPSQLMLTSGFLEDWNQHLGPNGLDAIRMVSVEVESNDPSLLAPYESLADWPIITAEGSIIANQYFELGVFEFAVPTILMICPDRSITVLYPNPDNLPYTGQFVYDPLQALSIQNNSCGCRGIACVDQIGCMDETACNYDPSATCPAPCTPPDLWFRDLDEDGFGDFNNSLTACSQPFGYVSNAEDCNDNDPNITPGNGCTGCNGSESEWINFNQELYETFIFQEWSNCFFEPDPEACFLANMEQYELQGIIPVGASCSACAYDYVSCIQSQCLNQCVGSYEQCLACIQASDCRQNYLACALVPDSDGDGWADGSDCQPNNDAAYPGSTEVCDGLDNDCNGLVDEIAQIYYEDLDSDGFGNDAVSLVSCTFVPGYSVNSGDCNDNDPEIYPGALEICGDGVDQNCDGDDCDIQDSDEDGLSDNDEAFIGTDPFNPDSDFDSLLDSQEIGDIFNPTDTDGDGLIDPLDFDDDNDGIETFVEFFDGINFGNTDTDFDGLFNWLDTDSDNDNVPDADEIYLDLDNDGIPDYIDADSPGGFTDLDGDGFSEAAGDCDDTDPDVYPGAVEICDTIDNDCDGIVDELCGDSDNDGLIDFDELNIGTNPFDPDSDNDGLTDGDEVLTYGTAPLDADSDDDGLSDGAEINFSLTSPFAQDTDLDGCPDLLQFGGLCGTPACAGDLNGDSSVNSGDLVLLLSQFGQICP